MPRWRHVPALAVALVLPLACGSDVLAASPTETLHGVFVAVNHLIETPQLQDKPADLLAAIRHVVGNSFDFREAARLALGQEWQALTASERAQFARLFADLLEPGYIARIASRAKVHGGLTISYRGELVEGNRATVVTSLVSRDGGELPLEYRLIRDEERWAVYDVWIDGVSLVGNYRAQFARVIRRSSYPELVAQMRAKAPDAPSGPIPTVQEVVAAVSPVSHQTATLDEPGPPVSPMPVRILPALITYWIQVGAFRNPNAAGGLAAHLLEQDFPVSIDVVAVAAGHRESVLSRVRVGPFSDRAEAAEKLRNLQSSGYQPFIALERD